MGNVWEKFLVDALRRRYTSRREEDLHQGSRFPTNGVPGECTQLKGGAVRAKPEQNISISRPIEEVFAFMSEARNNP